jgi:hypothetical protein
MTSFTSRKADVTILLCISVVVNYLYKTFHSSSECSFAAFDDGSSYHFLCTSVCEKEFTKVPCSLFICGCFYLYH